MNLSRKITAFDEGMMVYDNLIEDESAIFVNFALGICITQRTIREQLTEYLDDLGRDECQEIPDIDFDKMTDLDYLLKTGKLRNDMEALNGKTIREHIEENFKEYLDMKPVELQEHIYQEASWMANQLKVVYEKILHANPILFEKNFVRLLNRYDWSEVEQEHRKWKHEQSEITMEMLQEKRERALEKILRKGIFQYVPKPSANFMEKVDYQYHTKRLEFDFVDSDDYKVEFAKLMKYAVRKEELLIIDLKKYGKYIFLHFKDFREEQKLALFEMVVRINLIQQDMVEKKRELAKGLNSTINEQLEYNQQGPTEELFHFIHPEIEEEEGWKIHYEVKRLVSRMSLPDIIKYLKDMAAEKKILLPIVSTVAYDELVRMGMPNTGGFSKEHFRKQYHL